MNYDISCNIKTHNDRVDLIINCLRSKLIIGYENEDIGFY